MQYKIKLLITKVHISIGAYLQFIMLSVFVFTCEWLDLLFILVFILRLCIYPMCGIECVKCACLVNKFINLSVRVITKTGKYIGTCCENCPHVCGCGPVMIAF